MRGNKDVPAFAQTAGGLVGFRLPFASLLVGFEAQLHFEFGPGKDAAKSQDLQHARLGHDHQFPFTRGQLTLVSELKAFQGQVAHHALADSQAFALLELRAQTLGLFAGTKNLQVVQRGDHRVDFRLIHVFFRLVETLQLPRIA